MREDSALSKSYPAPRKCRTGNDRRMSLKIVTCLILLALSALTAGQAEEVDTKAAAELRAGIEESPKLPFAGVAFAARPPTIGWESGAVSWVAVDGRGNIYEIQRGDKADPVLVLDTEGKILRSWGKGDYKIPHSIRIDPAGDVWTVDAGSSTVIKYSPLGEKLMTLIVGEQPDNGSPFAGTTDIALDLTDISTLQMATAMRESWNTLPMARG